MSLIKCPECKHEWESVPHGTSSRYTLGCRCPDCKLARVDQFNKWRDKKNALKKRYKDK